MDLQSSRETFFLLLFKKGRPSSGTYWLFRALENNPWSTVLLCTLLSPSWHFVHTTHCICALFPHLFSDVSDAISNPSVHTLCETGRARDMIYCSNILTVYYVPIMSPVSSANAPKTLVLVCYICPLQPKNSEDFCSNWAPLKPQKPKNWPESPLLQEKLPSLKPEYKNQYFYAISLTPWTDQAIHDPGLEQLKIKPETIMLVNLPPTTWLTGHIGT